MNRVSQAGKRLLAKGSKVLACGIALTVVLAVSMRVDWIYSLYPSTVKYAYHKSVHLVQLYRENIRDGVVEEVASSSQVDTYVFKDGEYREKTLPGTIDLSETADAVWFGYGRVARPYSDRTVFTVTRTVSSETEVVFADLTRSLTAMHGTASQFPMLLLPLGTVQPSISQ